MLISISATPVTKRPLRVPPIARTVDRLVSLSLVKAFADVVFCHLDDAALLNRLSKLGIHSMEDIVCGTNTVLKAAKPGEKSFIDKDLPAWLHEVLDRNFDMHLIRTSSAWRGGRRRVITTNEIKVSAKYAKAIAWQLSAVYSYVASKLCTALSVDAKQVPAIAYYLVTGVAAHGTVPKDVKAVFTSKATTEAHKSRDDIDLDLLSVTDKLVTKHGHALIAKLPEMYNSYIEEARTRGKAPKPNKIVRKAGVRVVPKTRTKMSVVAARRVQSKVILAAVGPEMFFFFSKVIPRFDASAMTEKSAREKQMNIILDLNHKLSFARRLVRLSGPRSTAAKRRVAMLIEKLEKAKEALKNVPEENYVQPWMLPYLSASVEIKVGDGSRTVKVAPDDGIMIHRLVTRANARKLKAGSIELGAVLDVASADLLTVAGTNNIVDALDGDTVKAFKTVFKNCVDLVKPKVFAVAMSDRFGGSLETQLGKVTNARLLRINSITVEDEKAFADQYKDVIASWNPVKVAAKTLVDKLESSKKTEESKYVVKAVDKETLKAWQAELPHRIWGGHNVDCRLIRAWSCAPSPALAALLKNTKDSKLKVVPDVYHGTSQQTASIILHCGFKINGTQVTGRSMGNVLYIAPNIDKSAQYVGGGRGFFREGRGIIFVGDVVVSGASKSKITTGGGSFAWTKTGGFKTEEIGVVNPNKQFIIRRVYLIGKSRKTSKTMNNSLTKFKTPLTVAAYLALHPVNGK